MIYYLLFDSCRIKCTIESEVAACKEIYLWMCSWVKQSGFIKDARFTISKWEVIEAHMIKWQNGGGNSEDIRWNTREWQFENMDWKAEEDKAFGQEAWEALRCKEAEETLFRYPYIALALSLCLSSTGKMWQNIAKGS